MVSPQQPTVTTIPLARPSITSAELSATARVLSSGRLVRGPENEAFEQGLGSVTQRSHAVAVASGTCALELALWGLGIGAADEVAIATFGFVAAANAAARLGATVVPVDVRADTWNIDTEDLCRRVTPRTKAVISIDQLGLATDSLQIERAAEAFGLTVISDAACGLGSIDGNGRPGGSAGRVATLSFHPRKLITTGEGGAVLTNDDVLAQRVRELRNHGQAQSGEFRRVGTNGRLAEASAAMGRVQLERMPAMLQERRLLANGYRERLAPLQASGRLSWQETPSGAMHSFQTFAVLLNERFERTDVFAHLTAGDIESGPATYAFHRLKPHLGASALPVADALHDRGLALPLYVGMRSAELDRVVECLSEVLQ